MSRATRKLNIYSVTSHEDVIHPTDHVVADESVERAQMRLDGLVFVH